MSEFEPNPNPVLEQHITDPDLVALQEIVKERILAGQAEIKNAEAIIDGAREMDIHRKEAIGPKGEVVVDGLFLRISELLGSSLYFYTESNPEIDHVDPTKKLPEIERRRREPSVVTGIAEYREKYDYKPPLDHPALKKNPGPKTSWILNQQTAMDAVTSFAGTLAAKEDEKNGPTYLLEAVKEILEPLLRFDDYMMNHRQEIDTDAFAAEIMPNLPSGRTLDMIATSAFMDIARIVYAADPLRDPNVVTLQAAKLMDEGRAQGATFEQLDTFDENAVEVIRNAQDTMYVLASISMGSLGMVDPEEKNVRTWMNQIRDSYHGEATEKAHVYMHTFYELLAGTIQDKNYNPDVITQALALEEEVVTAFGEIFDSFKQRELIRHNDYDAVRSALIPHLKSTIGQTLENKALGEIELHKSTVLEQISDVEEPYKYTAKKIRGFEGGTTLLRKLGEELDRLDTLHDDETREELAVMMLQARTADDKTTYYDKLINDRYEIEEKLAGLRRLGIDEQTELTDILHWIDEVIDGGKVDHIRDKALKDFILEYFIGPDSTTLDLTGEEPVSDFSEPQPEPEQESVEPTPETEPVSEKKRHTEAMNELAIAQYFEELEAVLQETDIEYVDVAVFPPGKINTQHRGAVAAKREIGTFIDIDPNRLKGLVGLKKAMEQQGKSVRLIATSPTKWSDLPDFALYIQDSTDAETGVCILENPENGTASYIFTVDGELIQSWEEIATSTRQNARYFGAKDEYHPNKNSKGFNRHYDTKLKNGVMIRLAALRTKARQANAS